MKSKCYACSFLGALLLCSSPYLIGQQGEPPYHQPPYQTPPTFPPSEQVPQTPPQSQQATSSTIQQQIQDSLQSDTSLADTDIKADVAANTVVLTGSVKTEKQRDTALRIARSFAGDRTINDRIRKSEKSSRFLQENQK